MVCRDPSVLQERVSDIFKHAAQALNTKRLKPGTLAFDIYADGLANLCRSASGNARYSDRIKQLFSIIHMLTSGRAAYEHLRGPAGSNVGSTVCWGGGSCMSLAGPLC